MVEHEEGEKRAFELGFGSKRIWIYDARWVIKQSPDRGSLSVKGLVVFGRLELSTVSKRERSRCDKVQISLLIQSSLAVSVAVVNASAHFGRIACYYCEPWNILCLLSVPNFGL